jgi:hypothetical protein
LAYTLEIFLREFKFSIASFAKLKVKTHKTP